MTFRRAGWGCDEREALAIVDRFLDPQRRPDLSELR
jgi:hypothetical protein